MRDKIRIEFTHEEYEFVMAVKDDAYKKLSLMSKEERLSFFRKLCYEKNLNIEKEIDGTVYKVNSYFNNNSDETIVEQVIRLL